MGKTTGSEGLWLTTTWHELALPPATYRRLHEQRHGPGDQVEPRQPLRHPRGQIVGQHEGQVRRRRLDGCQATQDRR